MREYLKLSMGVFVSFIMIGSIFFILFDNPTQGDIATKFSDGANIKILKFDYAGSDYDTADFRLSVNSTIKSGYFKVKGRY